MKRLLARMMVGYRKGIWYETFNQQGWHIGKELHGFNFAGYLFMQVGYAF
jgi:hypothetical protein